MDKNLAEYRSLLISAEQKAQEDFDKTVIFLSGGALGISFAFVKDILGDKLIVHPYLLLISWIAWIISLASVLSSFYFSRLALRRAIEQVDSENVYDQTPGEIFSKITAILNALGALLFLVGVVFIVIFASNNWR